MQIMGIDIGTTTISIVLVDAESGKLTTSETVSHQSFLTGRIPEEKIQDPERIWRITKEKVDSLIHTYGLPAGIGITGQMHGMLYVDGGGNAVSPLYTWQDACGNIPLVMCRDACGNIPSGPDRDAGGDGFFERGKSSAGILREKAGASAAGYGIATHYYLQAVKRIPEEARKMTTISDHIAMKLCGNTQPVIGADMAASWGCFDLKKKAFRYDALENAGMEVSYLPEVRKEHFIAGRTQDGIPVMAAVGDNQASFFGAVASLFDTVLINVGTGSQVSFASEDFVSCEGSIELRPFTENGYLLAGSPLCGGRAYAMLEQFYREISGGRSYYDVMYEQAQEFVRQYGAKAAWRVTTAFSGTRDNPDERGSITGIGVENFRPGAMTVGVIRGILEELYLQYAKMCELTGKKAARLVGSGNGLRRNPLMQAMAEEMFGLELKVPEYQEEAACGAALCMAKLLD